ncbi:MAG: hypothetical protein KJS97_12095 [Alphaproteobacteria bacterium]|nr:hypothetical protein [Alphaproteobacteria bacterium]
MIRTLMITVAAGLVLAACGPAAQKPDAAHLTIGPGGAMGLKGATPFDVAAVGPAFAGLELAVSEGETEGQRFPFIAVRSGDEVVYMVAPGAGNATVHSVTTRSPLVLGPAGEVIGEATFANAPQAEIGYCGDEFFDGQPAFACSTAPDGRFWRVYLKLISDGAPESAELAEMTPAAKAQSPLVEMRWIAPR